MIVLLESRSRNGRSGKNGPFDSLGDRGAANDRTHAGQKVSKSTPCKVAAAIAEKTAGTADSSHKLMHAEMQARIGSARIKKALFAVSKRSRRVIRLTQSGSQHDKANRAE